MILCKPLCILKNNLLQLLNTCQTPIDYTSSHKISINLYFDITYFFYKFKSLIEIYSDDIEHIIRFFITLHTQKTIKYVLLRI